MNKYIKTKDGQFIIFSDSMNHADVADALNLEPLSAGFIVAHEDRLQCIGASSSLGVKMRPSDSTELYDWFTGFANVRH